MPLGQGVAAALFCLRITVVSATARTCVNGLTGVPDRLWRLPADVGGTASVIKRALLTAAVVCQQLCWISAGAVACNAVKHVCGHQHAYGAYVYLPSPTQLVCLGAGFKVGLHTFCGWVLGEL